MNKQEIEKALRFFKGQMDGGRCHKKNCETCDAQEIAIDVLEHQLTNGWIPVSSGILPEISEEKINEGYCKRHVLVYTDKEPRTRIAWFSIEDQKFYDDYTILGLTVKVSHWQYLPDEPQEVSE